jgi:hypothetical protein
MGAPSSEAATSPARPHGRVAALLLVCLALPLGSFMVDGHGLLAFTMYSATVTYRLEIAWLDDRGIRHALAPTDVAEDVSFDAAAPFLAGAEVYRTVPQIDALRAHLRDVAKAACRRRSASSIEMTLLERSSPVGSKAVDVEPATVQTKERVTCARSE